MSQATYLISEGIDNLGKHRGKTISTMLIICATMLILGVFIALFINIESNVLSVTENQGLQAFISDDVFERDINNLGKKIKEITNVKSVNYIDKDAALEDAKATLKEYDYLLEGMENSNPFPRSFIITFENLTDTEKVKKAIEGIDGIYKVSYNAKIVNAVVTISKIVNYIILAVAGVMVVISIFIVSNTIKLAVYSNKREIYIMKYIGATQNFIRMPFVIEGVLIGTMSAIISWIVVSLTYSVAFRYLPKVGEELGVFGFIGYSNMWHIILIAFAVLGIFMGALGSLIATKKYLKECVPEKTGKDIIYTTIKNADGTETRVGESSKARKERLTLEKKQAKEDFARKKEELKKATLNKKDEEKKQKEEFKKQRKARRLSILLIALVISSVFTPFSAVIAKTTQDKIDELDDQVSEAAKEYSQVTKDISIYEGEIARLDSEMKKYEEEIVALTEQADVARAEYQEIDAELQSVSKTYAEAEERLNIRLRSLYENGFVNMWDVLLSAESLTDFIAKYNTIVILIQNDKKDLEEMNDQKQVIQGLRDSAELRKLQIEQVEYDVKRSKEALDIAKANKTAKLNELEASKTKLNKLLKDLKAEKARQEEILRKEILASQNSGLILKGDFTWPTPGAYYVSAMFRDKEYYKEFGMMHYGTDIAKSGGCNVVAAASGTVLKVVYSNSGYGNYILINHGKKNGKSYVTLYAHLKTINVKKGEAVAKGEKIGYMGSTGFSTGTHLHFEIRENGKQINAMKYYSELGSKVKYLSYGKWITFPFTNMAKYQV
ncbi:MAG: permease-like cell division protein FtsX [Clostridia bacterium]|nr:permease-like cell division protein FtsX [Clostridia bacterium]